MTASWVDLTVPLVSDMPRAFAYPPPLFEPWHVGTQPNGEPVTATHIDMHSHVGTHIEAPRHILAAGATLEDYSLDCFVGRGYAAKPSASEAGRRVGVEDLAEGAAGVEPGCFLFLRLRNVSRDCGSTAGHSYLSEDAARWLVERGVAVVGVDTSTPDMHVSARRHQLDLPVHRILLGAGVLLIENLSERLEAVCGKSFTVYAWPLRIVGSDSSPVRVVLDTAP